MFTLSSQRSGARALGCVAGVALVGEAVALMKYKQLPERAVIRIQHFENRQAPPTTIALYVHHEYIVGKIRRKAHPRESFYDRKQHEFTGVWGWYDY